MLVDFHKMRENLSGYWKLAVEEKIRIKRLGAYFYQYHRDGIDIHTKAWLWYDNIIQAILNDPRSGKTTTPAKTLAFEPPHH